MKAFLIAVVLFLFTPFVVVAEVNPGPPTLTVGTLRNLLICSVNTSGVGSQGIAIATGEVEIASVAVFIKTSILGVISSSITTDDTVPQTIIGTTLLTNLTGGRNLTPYQSPFFLGDGKQIRITHVGTASGGNVLIGIEYFKGLGEINCL